MIKRAVFIALACVLIVPAFAAGKAPLPTGLKGWREAVITTSDGEAWDTFLTRTAGWSLRAQGDIDPVLIQAWGLPSHVTGQERLYANPGTASGFIRLLLLKGADQAMIRADSRPWDTGGHFDLNVRVAGLRAMRDTMIRQGWQGDSAPVQYTFGPYEVIEWIARGPDGVRLALIERLAPPPEGWPHLKAMSRTFNATQSVRDMQAARRFYEDVLGMQLYLEYLGASKEPGPNVLGLPHDVATGVKREVYILHPQGVNEGSIELLAFQGASGSDMSLSAKPYNLGVSALRYEVEDLDTVTMTLRTRGAAFEFEQPIAMRVVPYGSVRLNTLVSPEGARLDLFQREE
ncbi:MAG: VOC family protein [Pseudomonadota bacterium]